MQPGTMRTFATKMTSAKEGEAATKKDEGVVLNPDFKFNMEDVVSVCKRRGFIFQVGSARWQTMNERVNGAVRVCIEGRRYRVAPLCGAGTQVSLKNTLTSASPRAWQSSEIYNGFNGFYDYGPVGVEMKNNIKRIWWRDMVHRR